MGIRLPALVKAKHIIQRAGRTHVTTQVPKGHIVVYVGENQSAKKRYVVPLSYINQPSFQKLLRKAEEGFEYDHPTGGLTLPCNTETFIKSVIERHR